MSAPGQMKLRIIRRTAGLVVLAAVLAACEVDRPSFADFGFGGKVPLPGCPPVKLLGAAAEIVQYREGPGRDITDIVHESKFVGFTGNCEFIGDSPSFTHVKVLMRPTLDISRGPAATGRTLDLNYFVAIPDFYPRPEGRQEMSVRVLFPENRSTVRVQDEEISLTIPLSGGRSAPDTDIFLGFVLTEEQLKANQERRSAAGGDGR